MIAIIDYGVGNLGSVKNALDYLKLDSIITSDINEIRACDKLILPGVGAFNDAINNLYKRGLDKAIFEAFNDNKPILGICVGMQMLYDGSYENGYHKGLGLLHGDVKKFDSSYGKIPEIGWNQIKVINKNELLDKLDNENVYFVHSYFAPINEYTTSTTFYANQEYSSSIKMNNLYATQFHPEKSGEIGLKILKNFGDL